MGYIPPPDEAGSSASSLGINLLDGNTVIRIAIPHNPLVGLMWGPFTPALDNRVALALATGIQLFLGVWLFSKARLIYRNLRLYHLSRAKSLFRCSVPALAGTVLVFGLGLEIARMVLPYDPWYDEAKHWRKVSTRHGHQPLWWFGAYDLYTPMAFPQWSEMVNQWLKAKESEGVQPPVKSPFNLKIIQGLNRNGHYTELYTTIRDANEKRFTELLTGELASVDELNKMERVDLILEGKLPFVNPNYTKPHIQLGSFSIELDEEFEVAWHNFNPWDELKMETEFDIRLIPHSDWVDNQ